MDDMKLPKSDVKISRLPPDGGLRYRSQTLNRIRQDMGQTTQNAPQITTTNR